MQSSSSDDRPLIFVTNDDGIESPGLHASVEALAPLGDLLIVAPNEQRTGAGRSFPLVEGDVVPVPLTLSDGSTIPAFAHPGSPAQAVRHGLLLMTKRVPDLVVSGINYGENIGVGVTISGTVGAAIEAATLGVPALAVSLETEIEHHLAYSTTVDFSVAAYFAQLFARMMLELSLPPHTDLLKLDVPSRATTSTPWRITRVSRFNYFTSIVEEVEGTRQFAGYERGVTPEEVEPDSDIYAIMVDEVISLTPMTVDLTARSDLAALATEVEAIMGDRSLNSWPPGELPPVERQEPGY
jgi:5'-nucleotidase